MNITWRLISRRSWVSSKIGPVSLTAHRSTVYSKVISIQRKSILRIEVRNCPLSSLAPIPGQSDRYIDEWSPVTLEWGWPGLIIMQMAASPPGHQWSPGPHWQPICLWPSSCHHIQHSSNIQESWNCQKLTRLGLINTTTLERIFFQPK